MTKTKRVGWLLIIGLLLLPLLAGCGKSDDPSGPEDETPTPTPTQAAATPTPTPTPEAPTATPTPGGGTFPAYYEGMYAFNTLPWSGEIAFWIYSEKEVTGEWSGQDIYGNSWKLTISGYVQGGQLHFTLTGFYGDVPCEVSGEVEGTSYDHYESFTGTWSMKECHNLGFSGTWWANKVPV
jgi:hypothetical protein